MKKMIGFFSLSLILGTGLMLFPKTAKATCTVTSDGSSSGHSALRDCVTHQGTCGAIIIVTCPEQ